MLWSPQAVYGFVRAAGFPTDQWACATAVALACSAGDDLYRDVAWPGPSVDRRGLWAIDVVAHPELAAADLFDPRNSARAAYALWTAADGSYGWAGCPVPPVTSETYQTAMEAVRRGPASQPLMTAAQAVALDPAAQRAAVDLAGISDYVRSRIVAGGV